MKKWHIGCSGFNYPSWKKSFYPEDIKPSQWLEYYSTKFDTVELNNTFYKFPVSKNLERLYNLTPARFIFSVKAHKIITHTMRMNDTSLKIAEYSDIVENSLRDKLACILFQMPPSFQYSDENLEKVLVNVPHQSNQVVEFRHSSWWKGEVYRAFRNANLTFCNVSFPGLPGNLKATSDITYLRMHGVPLLFKSSYSSEEIEEIPEKTPAKSKENFVYFNNTMFEAGFRNALELKSKVEKITSQKK